VVQDQQVLRDQQGLQVPRDRELRELLVQRVLRELLEHPDSKVQQVAQVRQDFLATLER
jgi:hypothetical protein